MVIIRLYAGPKCNSCLTVPCNLADCTPKADSKPSDCKQVPSKCKDSECSIPGCVWWRSICPTTCNYCQAATATSTTMNDPVVSTSTATTTTSTTKAIGNQIRNVCQIITSNLF